MKLVTHLRWTSSRPRWQMLPRTLNQDGHSSRLYPSKSENEPHFFVEHGVKNDTQIMPYMPQAGKRNYRLRTAELQLLELASEGAV